MTPAEQVGVVVEWVLKTFSESTFKYPPFFRQVARLAGPADLGWLEQRVMEELEKHDELMVINNSSTADPKFRFIHRWAKRPRRRRQRSVPPPLWDGDGYISPASGCCVQGTSARRWKEQTILNSIQGDFRRSVFR